MSRHRFALVALALAPWAATAHANNDLNTSFRAGSIALPSVDGNASSDGGAAAADQGRVTYRLPIVAPPGRAGVEPDLALAYGGRGDGPLGAGWSLGLPSIRVKTSGRGGQPAWGTDETYLGFHGEDLIDAGTLPDVDGDGVLEAVLREERDLGTIRYVRLSDGGWRADYPDGRKLTLGTTAAARVERVATGWVARWLPETLEDASGNQLAYTWEGAAAIDPAAISPTERYLTAIRWGCRGCATATAYQELRLAYASRAGTTAGSVRDFGPGFLVETELYLTSITTASAGTHPGDVRTYALGYDTTRTRLLLTSVTITSADAALPPIEFTYSTGAHQAAQPESVVGVPGVLWKSGVQPMDLDHDGRVDVVDLSTASAKVYRNQGPAAASFAAVGTAITAPGALPTSIAVSMVDQNRDLGGDVFDLTAAQVYLQAGATGWAGATAVPPLPLVALGTDTVHADVDLDGHPDLIDTSGASSWTIYFNDGADGYTSDVVSCVSPTGTTEPTPQIGGVLHARDAGVLFDDVTADGLIDVVYVDADGNAFLFPGRGRGCWGYFAEDGHGVTTYEELDVTPSGGLPVPANLRLADLDGDGFGDLVEVGIPSRLNVWMYVPGAGWRPPVPGGPWTQLNAATSGCRIADFDHDAVAEVLCSTTWKLYDFADELPYLLTSIDNGVGVVTSFRYTTSGRVAATHAAAGTPWTTNLAATVPVVAAIEEDDGRGHVLERTFDYRDAYYLTDELEDRYEFVGFGYVAERRVPKLAAAGGRGTDPADAGALVRRYYDVGATDAYRRGVVTCEETWPGAAVPASFACLGSVGALVATHWSHATTIDPIWGFAAVRQTAEDRFVAEGTAAPTRLRTEWIHDAVGNVLQSTGYGRYKASNRLWGADEQVEVTDWVVDTAAWNLRLPSRLRRGRLTAAGAFTAMTIDYFHYDDNPAWAVSTVTRGLLTRQRSWWKDPLTGAQSTPTTRLRSYTVEGLVATETDAAGVVTSHTYDGSLHLLPIREELDPGGLAMVQEMTTDSGTGAEVRRVGPDGTVTEAGHDRLGRMIWLARPGDSPLAPTITRTYVDAAPVSSRTDVSADGTADGLAVTRTLDGHGRVVCEAREAGDGQLDVRQWDHTARGALALTVAPYRATGCDALAPTVSGGVGARPTTRDHDAHTVDALDRPLALAHSDGTAATWSYAVLATTARDEEDNAAGSVHADTPTTRRVDGLGRVIGVDEVHLLDDDDPGTHSFGYTWDALGNLVRVTDGAGRVVYTAVYDTRARRVRAVDADLGQTDTVFDVMGRPLVVTDARGVAVTTTWDAAGRVLTRGGPGGTTTYQYDVHPVPGQTAPCHTAGRLAAVIDPSGAEVLCYDDHGNPIRSDKLVAAHGVVPFTTQHVHDGLDRLIATTMPSGTVITYGHGDDGRVQDVTATSGAFAFSLATLTYRASGQLVHAALGNGVELVRTYDARRRPSRLIAATPTTTWLDLTLAHDGVGNLVAVTDAVGPESAAFTYDDLYRLTSATGARFGGATATYRYDRAGNLTRKESTDLASPAHLGALVYADPVKVHAVTAAGGATFTYDAAGHLAGDGDHAFAWTDAGLLAEVTDAATGALVYEVAYDHLDQRVHKASGSGDTVVYVPAAKAELRTEAGVAGWVERIAVAGIDLARLEGAFTAADVADHVFFPIGDHLGSPLVVLDAAGALVERASTHPWGEENTASLAGAGWLADYLDPTDPTTTLERRFQGRERDETGDYDYGARMYRPALGRFMSADTVVPDPSSSQAWNRFSFVRNNPLRYVDPTGHAEVEAAAAATAEVPTFTPTGPGAYPQLPAYRIADVPSSEWVPGGAVQDWQDFEARTGNDTFGEALADPLLAFKSQKVKAGLSVGSVGGDVAIDLGSGQVTAGVGVTGATPIGGKVAAKCSSSPSCGVSLSSDVATIGPHPVSATWKPDAEEISVSVGPQVTLGPGVKAKLVLETAFTYSVDTATRYGHRLWEAVTGTPAVTPAPTPTP